MTKFFIVLETLHSIKSIFSRCLLYLFLKDLQYIVNFLKIIQKFYPNIQPFEMFFDSLLIKNF